MLNMKLKANLIIYSLLVMVLVSSAFADDELEVLRFGLIPTESSTQITDRWQPLLDHIERVMNVKVKPYSASDYAGIIEAMRFKKIEVAYFGPKSYTEAAERSNAWAIAREMKIDGSTGYHGVLITKKDSGLKTFDDLKGKTFAFNDPNSTSGYLVPMTHFLRDLNIVPEEYFSRVTFSGSHEASMMSVKLGNVDAASTNDLDMDRKLQSGGISPDDFNIIWKSDMIPGSPLAVRGDLPYSFVMKLQKAIISFNDPKGLEKLQLGGFIIAEDSDYDPIRAMKKVKEELRNK
jgi:phosphonate transport system substrate-binding protein